MDLEEFYFYETDDHPVVYVSWNDAKALCMVEQEGEERVSITNGSGVEYACRAGTTTRFHFGDELTSKDAMSMVKMFGTTVVGSYAANAWGLTTMCTGTRGSGCDDRYGKYGGERETDPTGAAEGSYRVFRGGGWGDYAGYCRAAYRDWYTPDYRNYDLGFRVALSSVR